MYNLTIHFGPNAVAWSFLFKDKTKAENILQFFDKDDDGVWKIKDDYGQTAAIDPSQVHGMLLEDMELGTEARIIRGLDQAKGQARANKRASTDPELQQLNRSPNILSPFPSGARHQ